MFSPSTSLQYLYLSCNDLDEKTSDSELQVPQGN